MKIKVYYEIYDEAIIEVDDRYKLLLNDDTFDDKLTGELQTCIERKLGLGEDNTHINEVRSEDDKLIYYN